MDYSEIKQTAMEIFDESQGWEALGYCNKSYCRQQLIKQRIEKVYQPGVKQYLAMWDKEAAAKRIKNWNWRAQS